MKRYETMTKEEIVNAISAIGDSCGYCDRQDDECTCICYSKELGRCKYPFGDRYYDEIETCDERLAHFLNEEITVKKVPRFLAAKSIEDFAKFNKECFELCHTTSCENCKYSNHLNPNDSLVNCLVRYMAEEIEIVEELN